MTATTTAQRSTCAVCRQHIYRRANSAKWVHRLTGLPYSPWVCPHFAAPAESTIDGGTG